VERRDDAASVGVGEAVDHGFAVAAGVHQAVAAQAGELLGDAGLAEREEGFEFADGAVALGDQAEQEKAGFVGEGFEEGAGVAGRGA
jgi:hypothetical protein